MSESVSTLEQAAWAVNVSVPTLRNWVGMHAVAATERKDGIVFKPEQLIDLIKFVRAYNIGFAEGGGMPYSQSSVPGAALTACVPESTVWEWIGRGDLNVCRRWDGTVFLTDAQEKYLRTVKARKEGKE